ncbi:MAG: C_GCAxxG_C_C family protein [Firmicutes bacterium]|nr:C_GCAxxG_C_C family protein [Bacillota bacterium]
MLKDLLERGYGVNEDLNCAERILYGANAVYNLGFDGEDLKVAAGFGGGMAIESVCGALTASTMVLGRMYVKDRAHESELIKDLVRELFDSYTKEMGSIICALLKGKYRTKDMGCHLVIVKAAEILDGIIERNQRNGSSQADADEVSA